MIHRKTIIQIAIFGAIGILATLTHYLVALFCLHIIGLTAYVANLSGYLTAVSVSYFGHSKFTFRVEMTAYTLLKFTVVSVSTFLVSQFLLYLLLDAYQVRDEIALAVIVVLIPVVTFFISKIFVFTSGQTDKEQAGTG